MNQHLLSALRKELENSFGRKIVSSRDCLQLVDDIYQKTGYTINSNTLRRFFGLVKTAYTASPSTVTILSKYCGFGSIDEIRNIAATQSDDNMINKEEVMHYLSSLFKNLEARAGYNKAAITLVNQTVIFLERNPSLIDRFQREIAKTAAGQYYYYEQCVNMDRLNDYYAEGLRYYLRAAATNEARLFVQSLMVFRYWLTDNAECLEKEMTTMLALPVHHQYPSYVLGRLIAARLYYAHAHNESIDRILTDAAKYFVAVLANRNSTALSFPDFELAVCEALILTGHPEEAQEYIRKGKSVVLEYKTSDPGHPFYFWDNFINNKKNYHILLPEDIRKIPKGIVYYYNYPLNRRYYNLLQLQQSESLKSSQVAALVEETGFKRLHNLHTRKVENS